MSYEPFSDGGLLLQSGVPVRIKDSGGQGNWTRVPQPLGGEEGEVLTVQPDLSVAWEPATGGGGTGLLTANVTITNAALKSTVTSTTLIAAPGAGKVIVPIRYVYIMRYGGTNAFTNAPSTRIRYNNANNQSQTTATLNATFWQATTDAYGTPPIAGTVELLSAFENQPLTFIMFAAATGNAANDNTLDVEITYYIQNV